MGTGIRKFLPRVSKSNYYLLNLNTDGGFKSPNGNVIEAESIGGISGDVRSRSNDNGGIHFESSTIESTTGP